jgi:uncharacterized protein
MANRDDQHRDKQDRDDQDRDAQDRSRRWALITGASGGLGGELAWSLARKGYSLVLVARRRDILDELGKRITGSTGGTVVTITLDLTDTSELVATLQRALAEQDIPEAGIELLINNAGSGHFGPFVEEDPVAMGRAARLNMEAPQQLIRWIIPAMQSRGGGVICNVASVAAFTPGPLMASYYAAKAWMLSLGESLHEELKGSGIAVVTCCPGPFASDFHTTAGIDPRRIGRVPTAATVAGEIVKAIDRGRPVAPVGGAARVWALLGPRLPRRWSRRIIHRLQRRRRSP